MKTFALLVISAVMVSVAMACTSDSECPSGCCTHTKEGYNVCKPLGKKGDVCDLEGQHLADGVCQCNSGLVCEKIDLSGFDPIAASANPIFEKYHYGWCIESIVIG